MRRRATLLSLMVALAGCSSEPDEVPAVAEGGERISCAISGAQDFAEVCAVDRVQSDGGLTLIVRHPDGAFRRFAVVKDGRGIIAADGAEPVKTELQGDKLAVSISDNRYVFPATAKSAEGHAKP